jgi:hypothetical protein
MAVLSQLVPGVWRQVLRKIVFAEQFLISLMLTHAVPVQIVDKDAIVQQRLVNYAAVGRYFPG